MKKKKEENKATETNDAFEPVETTGKAEPAPVPERKPYRKYVLTGLCAALLCAAVGTGAYFAGARGETSAPVTQQETATQEAVPKATDTQDESDSAKHVHDWTVTYKTVHHDAVTHTEHIDPVFQNQTTYHTVCNDCKQVIDGKADEHIKVTGHSGYSTNVPITDEVMVSEGYDRTVTDTPAYDETVIDKMVCTTCGATKDASSAVTDATA